MSLKVFIGSSSEAQDSMEELAEWIEYHGHEPWTWQDRKTFKLGGTTLDSLRQVAEKVDAAIFLLSEDDTTWYRDDKIKSPRDNVLLEYGLFSGSLGKQAVAIAKIGAPKLPSDFDGLTYLSLDKKRDAKGRLKEWLTNINNVAGHSKQIAKSEIEELELPFYSKGKPSLFEQGTTLIQDARWRVALVAKTPIPIVGTRPYGQPQHAIGYEKAQFEKYIKIAETAADGGLPEFRCVSSIPALTSEIAEIGTDAFREIVQSNLNVLQQASCKHDSNFSLAWCEIEEPTAFVVADDNFLLWFKESDGENVWITAKSEIIARVLWDQAGRLSNELATDEIESRLGL